MNYWISFCANSKVIRALFVVALPFNMAVASLSPMWEFDWFGRLSALCCVVLSARIVFLHRSKVFWGIIFAIVWTQVFVFIAYECGKSRSHEIRTDSFKLTNA